MKIRGFKGKEEAKVEDKDEDEDEDEDDDEYENNVEDNEKNKNGVRTSSRKRTRTRTARLDRLEECQIGELQMRVCSKATQQVFTYLTLDHATKY